MFVIVFNINYLKNKIYEKNANLEMSSTKHHNNNKFNCSLKSIMIMIVCVVF